MTVKEKKSAAERACGITFPMPVYAANEDAIRRMIREELATLGIGLMLLDLRELRIAKGISSVAALARSSGVAAGTIAHLEAGTIRRPGARNPALIGLLSRALSVPEYQVRSAIARSAARPRGQQA